MPTHFSWDNPIEKGNIWWNLVIALANPHHHSKRPHVWETFLSAHWEILGCVCCSPILFVTTTYIKLWGLNCKSILSVLRTLWSDINNAREWFWAEHRFDCWAAALTKCTLIFRCYYISASSIFSCFKHATRFFQLLNPHSNSVSIRNWVVARKNQPSPKSCLCLYHGFVVFRIRPHIKFSMLSCPNHNKETISIHLPPPQH